MKKLTATFIALLLGLVPTLALAETAAGVSAGAHAGASTTAALRLTALETKAKDRGVMEIDRRINNLNELAARVSEMKNLSDADKASITAAVNVQAKALADLKVKISADTDLATLKTDVQSITISYRIYALLIPQVRIISAADRIVTITRELQQFSAKLQARISAAQAAGADVSAETAAFTDFNAKIADAQTQAQAAVTAIATLSPDQGDAAKLAANTKVLQSARAQVVAGQKDIRAAYADAQTIIKGVRGKGTSANASASSTTSAGTGQ